jgi:hypothetical protein
VSECGIASAYLKPLEAADLVGIAQALQDLQAGPHFSPIASDQRPLAPDAGGVRDGTRPIEERDRPIEPAQVSLRPAEGSFGLCVHQRIFTIATERADR